MTDGRPKRAHSGAHATSKSAPDPWRTLPENQSTELHAREIRKLSRANRGQLVSWLLFGVVRGAAGQAVLFRDKDMCNISKFSNENLVAHHRRMQTSSASKSSEHAELADLVSLRDFGGRAPALIMPRFAHERDDQHQSPDVVDAVKREIRSFVRRGLLHNDLHWRHVGLYTDKKLGTSRGVL